jgi:hypothetical protein
MVVVSGAVAQEKLPWQEEFERAQSDSPEGPPDRVLLWTERAWQLLREAGPTHSRYREAVGMVVRFFESQGRNLRAENVYEQALAAAHGSPELQRELRIMQASFLDQRGKALAAE